MQKKRLYRRLFPLLLACLLLLCACSAEPEAPANTVAAGEEQNSDILPEMQAKTRLSTSKTLLGFIVPDSGEVSVYSMKHGFLRTAETLGYPAKLYTAPVGESAAAAVEQAKQDGVRGLLIYNPDGVNDGAVERAAGYGIPTVVPYHEANTPGLSANVVADVFGYTEEIALRIAERMVERECKAGQILVYGYNPYATSDAFKTAIETYYPQFNVAYFVRTKTTEEEATGELATHILWHRDIKGLFCTDTDGANIAVKAREEAQREFRKNGAPENATPSPGTTGAASPSPSLSPTPSPSPSPDGSPSPAFSPSVSPDGGTGPASSPAAGSGASPAGTTPVPEGLIKSIIVSVAGYGLTDETILLMRGDENDTSSGNDIYAIVVEPYYEAGAQSTLVLDRILNGETVPESIRLNMPIVRMETLDKYVLIHEQVLEWFGLTNP